MIDFHAGAELVGHFRFQTADIRVGSRRRGFLCGPATLKFLDQCLGCADRQTLTDDFAGGVELFLSVREREQRAGVSHLELPRFQQGFHLVRQVEQAQQIAH